MDWIRVNLSTRMDWVFPTFCVPIKGLGNGEEGVSVTYRLLHHLSFLYVVDYRAYFYYKLLVHKNVYKIQK